MVTDLYLSPNHNPPLVPPDSGTSALPWISRRTPAATPMTPFRGGLCFGDGKFVAVGFGSPRRSTEFGSPGFNESSGDAMYSEDGVHWTTVSTPIGIWTDVAYGGGLFVAVSRDFTQVMTSPDGIHWTARTTPINRPWCSVAYGDGLWIAIAPTTFPDPWQVRARFRSSTDTFLYGPSRSMYSFDGINWFANSYLDNLADSGGAHFALPDDFIVIDNVYYDPRDPESLAELAALGYSVPSQPTTTRWSSIAYGKGHFVAVSSSDQMWAYLKRSDFRGPFGPGDEFEGGDQPNWVSSSNLGPSLVSKVTFVPTAGSTSTQGKFVAVRYGPQLRGSSLGGNSTDSNGSFAFAWQNTGNPSQFSWWAPLDTPLGNAHGWADAAGNPDTGTVVAVQPITAPTSSRKNQFKDIFAQLAAAISGSNADSIGGTASDEFRAYVPTLVRMEKNWPAQQSVRAVPTINGEEVEIGPFTPMGSVIFTFVLGGEIAGLRSVSNNTPRRGYGLIAYGNGRFVALETEPAVDFNPDNTPQYLNNYFDIPRVNTTSYVSLDDGNSWVYNVIDGSTDWISVTFGANAQIEKSGSLLPDQPAGIRIRGTAVWGITSPTPFTPTYARIRLAARAQWDVVVSNTIEFSVTVDDPSDDKGVFVAISSHNAPDPIMWSPTGVTWTRSYVEGTDELESQWSAVAWGGDRFAALGNTTEGDPILGGPLPTIMTSADGVSWTAPRVFQIDNLAPAPGFQGQKLILKSLVYGADRWIAVGHLGGLDSSVLSYGLTDATVVTSTDLQHWRIVTDGVPNFTNWNSVDYGNGLFTAVGQLAQTEAVTWTNSSTGGSEILIPSQPLHSAKVGSVESMPEDPTFGLVMTSPDGLHWTARRASHLGDWRSVVHGNYDGITNFWMAINNNYLDPVGLNELSQDILKLIRLIRLAAQNREIAENFPQLAFGVTGWVILQAIVNIQHQLETGFNFLLDLISQTANELAEKALALSSEAVERLQYVLSHLTMNDLSDGSGSRISQLLGGGNIFDDLAEGYTTQQAMCSLDNGITWTAMETLPGTYTGLAWGADYCVAVADANPYRQTYSTGQVMQSYLHQPWINAVGARNGQPPPLARAWKAVTCGRGRFVAVGNGELAYGNKNPTDVSYGLSHKQYRRALDDLVMTCDPFCQPLLPRRTESAKVKTITKLHESDMFKAVGLTHIVRTLSTQWNVDAHDVHVRAAAAWVVEPRDAPRTATARWDVLQDAAPSGASFEAVLRDSSDLTFLTAIGGGLQFSATFDELENPYGKNIESFRIAVRCSQVITGPWSYYPTAPSNQGSIVPVRRGTFYNRATRIAAEQNSLLLYGELTEYTYDTYRYEGYPTGTYDYELHPEVERPEPFAEPVPGLYIDIDGLDDIFVYSRGQNLNPDDRITTFNSLQFQKRSGGAWTPEAFAKMKATIWAGGRIYSLRCEVTYAPDWHKPSCDPDRFYRPPWSARTRSGTWDTKKPFVWRLAREVRARWDVGQVSQVNQPPDTRIRFTP